MSFYKVLRNFRTTGGATVFAGDNIELDDTEAAKYRRSGAVGNRFIPETPRSVMIETATEKKPKKSVMEKFGKKSDELVS